MESLVFDLPTVWIYFAAGSAAGILMASLAAWWRARLVAETYGRESARIREAHRQLEERYAALQRAHEEAARLSAVFQERERGLVARKEELEAALALRDAALTRLQGEKGELQRRCGELEARLKTEREGLQGRLEELRAAKAQMAEEFELLAARIMERNSDRFGDISKERIEGVLKPLQEQMEAFRSRIETVHSQETRSLAALINEIKNLKSLNMQISQEAINLTRALRGEHKTQGIWGEMVLERVLEASGLRQGVEYEREVSLENGEKRRYRPDVIVRLPQGREMIIDAKTSLNAYGRYMSAEDETQKRQWKKAHLAAIKKHIEGLAKKDYAKLQGIETLDFVLMFIPVEGALALALEAEPTLYEEAFEKHILLVSPTTLLTALRTVENLWRHERRNRNALKIAEQAGSLYDKFVGFAEDMQRIGAQIETLQRSYDGAMNKLREGRGNLIRQAETLKELGAKTAKELPKELRD